MEPFTDGGSPSPPSPTGDSLSVRVNRWIRAKTLEDFETLYGKFLVERRKPGTGLVR